MSQIDDRLNQHKINHYVNACLSYEDSMMSKEYAEYVDNLFNSLSREEAIEAHRILRNAN